MKHNKYPSFIQKLTVVVLLAAAVPWTAPAGAVNMVIFIGDGMGFEHVKAGRLYRNGIDTLPLTFETLSYHGKAITRLPDGNITDSATAGTALATGYQHPVNGIISMGTDNSIKTTILELAKAKGLRTGIITTDSITGATPGTFGAHEPNRTYETDIRYDYLMDGTTYQHLASLPNVLFGGGYDDPAIISGVNSTYVGVADRLGYVLAKSASELSSLMPPANYALGLFSSGWTPMDAFLSGNAAQPRLPDMVSKALQILGDNNSTGFFLMVEGALIDKLSHINDAGFAAEVAQLDLAVEAALNWANQSGQGLFVIVTADHETGGVNVPDGQQISPGTLPSLTFGSTGHTGVDVPVYANWPSTIQNQTIDNTEVFFLMEDRLEGGKPPQITGVTISEITAASATVQWNTTEPSDSRVESVEMAGPVFDPMRVTSHALVCNGLQPGVAYEITVSSMDLAGNIGTATAQFTTSDDRDAVVRADPIVTIGSLSGSFDAVNALDDGLSQAIMEGPDGAGSGIQVEYILNTPVATSEIGSLNLYGAVTWTRRDGTKDELITEIRVLDAGGSSNWVPITLDPQIPFQAAPAGSYVDSDGNIVIRFTDSAAFRRERKDALSIDYLAGKVERVPEIGFPPTTPAISSAVVNGSESVTLTWSESGYATWYEIRRCQGSSDWTVADSVWAGITSFTDTGLLPSTTYTYTVRAFNSLGYADSAPVTVTTAAPQLAAPENLTAKAGKGVINLAWTDSNA
ncbi:MAG: alkaline phosphatase, partial [Candidatus Omnitrophica bacterium]|nr:alkaline phosphatase [Candidatus Omnitrophota bacterium]